MTAFCPKPCGWLVAAVVFISISIVQLACGMILLKSTYVSMLAVPNFWTSASNFVVGCLIGVAAALWKNSEEKDIQPRTKCRLIFALVGSNTLLNATTVAILFVGEGQTLMSINLEKSSTANFTSEILAYAFATAVCSPIVCMVLSLIFLCGMCFREDQTEWDKMRKKIANANDIYNWVYHLGEKDLPKYDSRNAKADLRKTSSSYPTDSESLNFSDRTMRSNSMSSTKDANVLFPEIIQRMRSHSDGFAFKALSRQSATTRNSPPPAVSDLHLDKHRELAICSNCLEKTQETSGACCQQCLDHSRVSTRNPYTLNIPDSNYESSFKSKPISSASKNVTFQEDCCGSYPGRLVMAPGCDRIKSPDANSLAHGLNHVNRSFNNTAPDQDARVHRNRPVSDETPDEMYAAQKFVVKPDHLRNVQHNLRRTSTTKSCFASSSKMHDSCVDLEPKKSDDDPVNVSKLSATNSSEKGLHLESEHSFSLDGTPNSYAGEVVPVKINTSVVRKKLPSRLVPVPIPRIPDSAEECKEYNEERKVEFSDSSLGLTSFKTGGNGDDLKKFQMQSMSLADFKKQADHRMPSIAEAFPDSERSSPTSTETSSGYRSYSFDENSDYRSQYSTKIAPHLRM